MPPRTAPSPQALADALSVGHGRAFGGIRLTDDNPLTMFHAEEIVRQRFRTIGRKAQEWLWSAAPQMPGVTLVSVSGHRWDGAGWERLPQWGQPGGWSEATWQALRFDTGRRRLAVTARRSTDELPHPLLVRTSSLPIWLAQVTRELADRDTARRASQDSTLAEFRRFHGDALDTLAGLLTAAMAPDVPGNDCTDLHDLLSVHTSDRTARVWGTPGGLTVTLHGGQIDAVGRALADLYARAGVPVPDVSADRLRAVEES